MDKAKAAGIEIVEISDADKKAVLGRGQAGPRQVRREVRRH